MACLLTPAAAAIVTTGIKKKIPAKYHIEWLITMLWGGTIMLIVDHLISGEITVYPPFLTALNSPEEIPVMLNEIIVTGGLMTAAIIVTWAIMVLIASKKTQTATS